MEENYELYEEKRESKIEKNNLTKPASGVIYAIIAILTPLVGSLLGVFSSFYIAVGNMTDAKDAPKDFSDRWYVDFVSNTAQEDFLSEGIMKLIAIALVFIAGVVILCVLSGRFGREKDENGVIEGPAGVKLNWFDKIWSEVNFILFALACTGAVSLCVPIVEIMPEINMFENLYKPFSPNLYYFGIRNETIIALCAMGMIICVELAILCFVAMVKKFKARRFWETTLLVIIFEALAEYFGKINQKLSAPEDGSKNAARLLILKYMLIGIATILACAVLPYVFLPIAIIGMIYYIPKKVSRFMDIRNGVAEVKSGNLDYEIQYSYNENGPISELDKLSCDINCISQATNNAVQNELKNQRMKADLISNVSHDLRTPLTSMITYVDLLKREGLDSLKAAEYLAVIDEKTNKLKSLTDDLFEAAKASSGNIPCELTVIDMNFMLDQELAEMSEFLDKNKLKIIKSCKAENTKVMADGRHLSRVIENVLSNVSKYALPKSRVYVDISEAGNGKLLLEVKNISRDQLNISADELMERFARGDDSRNTDGSGLGLSIAKDLTRLMGGAFDITIDGDMFKASIILNCE